MLDLEEAVCFWVGAFDGVIPDVLARLDCAGAVV